MSDMNQHRQVDRRSSASDGHDIPLVLPQDRFSSSSHPMHCVQGATGAVKLA